MKLSIDHSVICLLQIISQEDSNKCELTELAPFSTIAISALAPERPIFRLLTVTSILTGIG